MFKKILYLLLSISFLNAEFPTFDEVFSNKKPKVKYVYVKEKQQKKKNKQYGPSMDGKYSYNPLANYKEDISTKGHVNYPVNKNKQKMYSGKRYKKTELGYTDKKGPEALQEQVKGMRIPRFSGNSRSAMKSAKNMDYKSGKKVLDENTNKINKKSFKNKIEKYKKRNLDAVDRLHMMAQCEAKAKTNKEKEKCWDMDKGKKEVKQKKEKKNYKLEQPNMGMETEKLMNLHNNIYKNNKYQRNPMQ